MKVRPSEAQFLRLAGRGNVIPVCAELPADLETPVSAFLKLDQGSCAFLLESVAGEEKVARFSFLGSRPRWLVTASGRHLERSLFTPLPGSPAPLERALTGHGREAVVTGFTEGRPVHVERFETLQDPLAEVERLMGSFHFVPLEGLPRFCGGLVGYFGYSVARYVERLPSHRMDDLHLPDLMLMLTDAMAIFDHSRHTLLLVAPAHVGPASPRVAYRRAVSSLEAMAARLRGRLPATARSVEVPRRSRVGVPIRSNVTQEAFARMVTRAKRAIRAGEIIQVVLSQRFTRPLRATPLDVYRALRSLNPSPYMFLLKFGGVSLVGASPEMLVRCEEGRLETRPIAGTRRRGRNEREEAGLIQQLRRSPKERAEHLMLVDLGRNDLGRVARPGSVQTPELMVIEQYSHVLHLVSRVTARVRPGVSAVDVLRATFPAGTVTGAPKVRAMELIAELERTERGPYAGAVGYLSFSGNLDTCITIRTILMKDGQAFVQAGAGIVADSQPAREYRETLTKARGMLAAIEQAERP